MYRRKSKNPRPRLEGTSSIAAATRFFCPPEIPSRSESRLWARLCEENLWRPKALRRRLVARPLRILASCSFRGFTRGFFPTQFSEPVNYSLPFLRISDLSIRLKSLRGFSVYPNRRLALLLVSPSFPSFPLSSFPENAPGYTLCCASLGDTFKKS